MLATFAPCCDSKECGGVMVKMDKEVAAFLIAVLNQKKYITKPIGEEMEAELKSFAESFAADIAHTILVRDESITRMTHEDAPHSIPLDKVFALQSEQDLTALFAAFPPDILN